MATTKSPNLYTDVKFEDDCYIMFGKESAGIPEEILAHHKEDTLRIPMVGDIRSLNLGNSVAIVLYEALRQNGFAGMNTEGHLHRLEWDKQKSLLKTGALTRSRSASLYFFNKLNIKFYEDSDTFLNNKLVTDNLNDELANTTKNQDEFLK